MSKPRRVDRHYSERENIMKKNSKKVEAKKCGVCVPNRFPDSSALLKTGVKAGLFAVESPDGGTPSPGTCPPGKTVVRVM
jgi:hypothetical protein